MNAEHKGTVNVARRHAEVPPLTTCMSATAQHRMKAGFLARAAFSGAAGAIHFQDGASLRGVLAADARARDTRALFRLGHWAALELAATWSQNKTLMRKVGQHREGLSWFKFGLLRAHADAGADAVARHAEKAEQLVHRVWSGMDLRAVDVSVNTRKREQFARVVGIVAQCFAWPTLSADLFDLLASLSYETQLLAAAMSGGTSSLDQVQELFDSQARGQSECLLSAAAFGGDVATFAWLRKQLKNSQDNGQPAGHVPRTWIGWTACFNAAVEMGHLPMARYIDNHGTINIRNLRGLLDPPVVVASRAGDLPVLRFVLGKGGDPNEPTAQQETPLMAAARAGHLPIVEWLVQEARADVNFVVVDGCANNFRTTALLDACSHGCAVPIVEYLLEQGANLRATDHEGATPLIMAARHGHLSLTRLLLCAIADPQSFTSEGQSALNYAESTGHTMVANELLCALSQG